jgi:hypothetical protein
MEPNTVIVRFPDEGGRTAFRERAATTPELASARLRDAEFLPDVIAHGLTEKQRSLVRALAGPRAKLIDDFSHDLF